VTTRIEVECSFGESHEVIATLVTISPPASIKLPLWYVHLYRYVKPVSETIFKVFGSRSIDLCLDVTYILRKDISNNFVMR